MIDLHTHTVFTDGVFLPAELLRRLEFAGREAVAITDHVDNSNYEFIVERTVRFCEEVQKLTDVKIVPGVELTHLRLQDIAPLTEKVRKLGAKVVLCHGETIVEPVMPGTNREAIQAGVDILAHPGLISPEDAALAAQEGVYLELTSKVGHSLANGHVVTVGRNAGASFSFGSDLHLPEHILTEDDVRKVLHGAGLAIEEVDAVFDNNRKIVETCCR